MVEKFFSSEIKDAGRTDIEINKTDGIMSRNEITDFINDELAKLREDPAKIPLENVEGSFLGWDEEDIDVDFEIDDSIESVLDRFDENEWESLSEHERTDAIEELIFVVSKALGIEKVPKVKFYSNGDDSYGGFIQDKNTIELNKRFLDDPKEMVNTAMHETRHAYQHMRAGMLENSTDQMYKNNFDNYIYPIRDKNGNWINFLDYQDQFVEAEARVFASLFDREGVVA